MMWRKRTAPLVRWAVWLLLALAGLASLAVPTAPAQGAPQPLTSTPTAVVIDPLGRIQQQVVNEVLADGTADYIVVLQEQAATHNALPGWAARGQYVYDHLTTTAHNSQAALLLYLAAQQQAGHVSAYTSFWVINAIAVSSDAEVLTYLASQPEVQIIWPNGAIEALGQPHDAGTPPPTLPTVEHNITAIGVPDVWAAGERGAGVTVAVLDSGVAADHPALARKYRGWTGGSSQPDYNWWDAVNGQQAAGPYDDAGHGTHTAGVVLGSDPAGAHQIGVAPDAKWIAVKMLDADGQGTDSTALQAMQWILAPTRADGSAPRPDLRPQVVSNAWGAVCGDAVLRGAVVAWRDAGIFAVFASGDNGALAAPAAFPEAFAVGAVDDSTGRAAAWSGHGLSCYDNAPRPDLLAPGVGVRSSLAGGYSPGWDGTSQAAAHVAGVAALLLAAQPDLGVNDVEYVLTSTAHYASYMGARPSTTYGWGLLDALAAYRMVAPVVPTPQPTPPLPPSNTPTVRPTMPPSVTPPPPSPTAPSTPSPQPQCQARFDDVPPGHWAYGYVTWFYCHNYVSGYGNGHFAPDASTSRAQFTKMLVLSRGWALVTPATPAFSDVPLGHWAYSYVETARRQGVLTGYGDGTFGPANPITRAQMAKMLVSSSGWPQLHPARPTFADVAPDHWAAGWIEALASHGIASGYGDGTFRPRDPVTRAQLSKLLYRALTQP